MECMIARPSKGSAGKTGLWRTFKPIYDENKCNNCLLCWLYCPENAIDVVDGKISIDYDYCKGCGVCAKICAKKAIEMVREDEL